MKFLLTLSSSLAIFGCGITSLIFGLPERYIERSVRVEEIVGTWKVTPNSETDVNDLVKRFPDWGVSAPWKTITINDDNTCVAEVEVSWLGNPSILPNASENNKLSCLWRLTSDMGLNDHMVRVVELEFEYPNDYDMGYHTLYIFEENEKLILWKFIGDPDDFRPQDFMKTEQ